MSRTTWMCESDPTEYWKDMRSKRTNIAVTGLLLLAGVAFADGVKVNYDIISKKLANNAVLLRERALLDNLSVDIVESITTEVGPRRAGTEGDKRAIAWAAAKFKELGFDRVWTEEVPIERGWIRGDASAEIVSPYPHDIVMTALGYSVGTRGDLIGEIVEFADFEALEAVPEGDSLKGKIAFVSYSMADYVPQAGERRMAGYGKGTRARGRGHVAAAKRGAEVPRQSLFALSERTITGTDIPVAATATSKASKKYRQRPCRHLMQS